MKVICPYCKNEAQLVTGFDVYPHRKDLVDRLFYRCNPCDAHTGCHLVGSYHWEGGRKVYHDGSEPLGRLANSRLRRARQRAHGVFDPLWRDKGVFPSRTAAYTWLAEQMQISRDVCHIGQFDLDDCNAVVHHVLQLKVPA